MTAPVNDYLARFDGETRKRLQLLRGWTTALAPTAKEGISYGLLSFQLHGRPLIYFGGFAKHVGVYAAGDALVDFADRLSDYTRTKGSIRFPLDQPFDADLLGAIIAHRAAVVGESLPPIGRPASSALAEVGITHWSDLAGRDADGLLALHGVGPKSIAILRSYGAPL
ncbi:MAG: DUF1801 domain-containing protein [Gordonia sp. (in: high G+C Gram-positive bacteria)]|uniref:iron chaperone n=1 Tax=Gordonia sp. (in: high G+C Gram-positive bacteria) TaxID=84139 RepID=UPI003BB68564